MSHDSGLGSPLNVGERHEERIPLGLDFGPAGCVEGGAEQTPVLGNHSSRVVIPERWRSSVDPSMSVKRNVTVPAGRVPNAPLPPREWGQPPPS